MPTFSKPYKNNAKWIKGVGRNLCDFELGKDFLDKIRKTVKDKINKLDFIKN